ncbi:MAG: ABC transporter permease [Deltaproteobacteria bacterium]|nr:ABC transporter permease [Deltaproteobacteria bacterium]
MAEALTAEAVLQRRPWRRRGVAGLVLANAGTRAGAAIILAFVLIGLFAGSLAPYDPMAIDLTRAFRPPTWSHLFGTDNFGRDLFSRVLFGARYSLLTGCVAVAIALAVSVPLGLTAGYYGGAWDFLLMRVIDILLSFPTILLAIAIVTIVGPNLQNAMIAVGVASIPLFSRLVRGSVLAVKQQAYVEAARALGERGWRISLRHVLPNCLAVLVVQSSLRIATAILTAAGLSFLGLGAQPPLPEWGAMVNQGKDFLHQSLAMSVFPGLAIMLVVLGFNIFGDGLNDALNPQLRE